MDLLFHTTVMCRPTQNVLSSNYGNAELFINVTSPILADYMGNSCRPK